MLNHPFVFTNIAFQNPQWIKKYPKLSAEYSCSSSSPDSSSAEFTTSSHYLGYVLVAIGIQQIGYQTCLQLGFRNPANGPSHPFRHVYLRLSSFCIPAFNPSEDLYPKRAADRPSRIITRAPISPPSSRPHLDPIWFPVIMSTCIPARSTDNIPPIRLPSDRLHLRLNVASSDFHPHVPSHSPVTDGRSHPFDILSCTCQKYTSSNTQTGRSRRNRLSYGLRPY